MRERCAIGLSRPLCESLLGARCYATRRYAFSDPELCETIWVPTAAPDHGKETFLTLGQREQRP